MPVSGYRSSYVLQAAATLEMGIGLLACEEGSSWTARKHSTRVATILWPAFPSHNGGIREAVVFSFNDVRAASTIAVGFVPMSRLVPLVIVTGRSVLFRSVMHGTPSAVVSS